MGVNGIDCLIVGYFRRFFRCMSLCLVFDVEWGKDVSQFLFFFRWCSFRCFFRNFRIFLVLKLVLSISRVIVNISLVLDRFSLFIVKLQMVQKIVIINLVSILLRERMVVFFLFGILCWNFMFRLKLKVVVMMVRVILRVIIQRGLV